MCENGARHEKVWGEHVLIRSNENAKTLTHLVLTILVPGQKKSGWLELEKRVIIGSEVGKGPDHVSTLNLNYWRILR